VPLHRGRHFHLCGIPDFVHLAAVDEYHPIPFDEFMESAECEANPARRFAMEKQFSTARPGCAIWRWQPAPFWKIPAGHHA